MTEHVADFIIVGAGSAGCVLANKLSEDPRHRVLLFEAGKHDSPLFAPSQFASNISVRIPAGFGVLLHADDVLWDYRTTPDAHTGNRTQRYPRGKIVGGCSSINGMMYMRGMPSDFDRWAQLGCHGWGWSDVLPLFEGIENAGGPHIAPQRAPGPLRISTYPLNPTTRALLAALGEAGYDSTENANGDQAGVSPTRHTISSGRRVSAATAFLHPARNRANLRVETRALVNRILFVDGRAAAIEFDQDGKRHVARASREIVLSAGAINSPHLLELSGIGDAARLQSFGITPVCHSPRVGENLQDHYCVRIPARLKNGAFSLNGRLNGLLLLYQLVRYGIMRNGPLAQSVCALTGYLRTKPAIDPADMQFMATLGTVDAERTSAKGRTVLDTLPGLSVSGYQLRPKSRGSVHAQGPSPLAQPEIRPNYLSAHDDQLAVIDILRSLHGILEQPSIARIIDHLLPPAAALRTDGPEGLLDYARMTGYTAYHPVGTCAMSGDPGGVCDPELRVRGVRGLRIADASIMPRLVSANTAAACMMIGARAADMILND